MADWISGLAQGVIAHYIVTLVFPFIGAAVVALWGKIGASWNWQRTVVVAIGLLAALVSLTLSLVQLLPSTPNLKAYVNGHALSGYRLVAPVKRVGDNPVAFSLTLPQFEIREEGKKIGAQLKTIRLFLSQEKLYCYSPCTGIAEPGDRRYPSVTHFHSSSINPDDKVFLPSMDLHSLVLPSKEIQGMLEVWHGTPDPLRVKFTVVRDGPHQ